MESRFLLASDEIRRCLIDLDIDGIVRVWGQVQPGFPVPSTRQEVLVTLHLARTAAITVPFRLRAYSHRWLTDNGYPSQLPDRLKPRAERIYPRTESAVGIAVKSKYPVVKHAIQTAMQQAVLEAYADGHSNEPEIVRQRMLEARRKEQRGLGL
jgi:hypothetical protein